MWGKRVTNNGTEEKEEQNTDTSSIWCKWYIDTHLYIYIYHTYVHIYTHMHIHIYYIYISSHIHIYIYIIYIYHHIYIYIAMFFWRFFFNGSTHFLETLESPDPSLDPPHSSLITWRRRKRNGAAKWWVKPAGVGVGWLVGAIFFCFFFFCCCCCCCFFPLIAVRCRYV